MAGDTDKMKQVSFLGAWRTQQISDQLLRQISNQIATKKKIATKLDISSEGMELFIFNAEGKVTRRDKIAIENIVDFIDNKYSTTCTLAIVREKQQKLYTVFVFLCKSDRDAAGLIHTFKTTKRQLSGEGYNTNLTPKGTNWTLQQKSEKSDHKTLNGDVRGKPVQILPVNDVTVINTEKQNGSVTVIHAGDRHDSFSRESVRTSNSEVKEELHVLADEVRDIKRMLQGSKGRTQFQKHYGYRILQDPVPEERQIEFIERNINTRPSEPRQGNVYVKNEAKTRSTSGNFQVVKIGGGIPRSTRRFKSNVPYIPAKSPTRVEYTKRVYTSRNPFEETGSGIQPIKVITRNAQPVLVPRQRLYQSNSVSTDIIHKNIEDVYKSRSLRRIYLPPPVANGKTVEYVNSQIVQQVRQQPQKIQAKTLSAKESELHTVRVKYSPEIRTYYESNESEPAVVKSNTLNVNTHVNTSVTDNLDEKRHFERIIDTGQKEPKLEKENVVVVKTTEKLPKSSSAETDPKFMHIKNDITIPQVESNTAGDGVYYVRAALAEDYEKTPSNGEHVTIIRNNVEKSDFIDLQTTEDTAEVKETVENCEDNDVGLFEAYSKRPDEYEEPRDKVTAETAYRYHEHEDEIIVEESRNGKVGSAKEDGGLFGAYAKEAENNGESKTEIIKEISYQYHDKEIKEENTKNEENGGEEIQEVLEEKRVHYNETVEHIPLVDDEPEHDIKNVNNSTDVYEAVKEEDGDSQDQFRQELDAVVSRLRHNYDENIKEDNNNDTEKKEDEEEYVFDMNALKAFSMEPDIILVEADNDKSIENESHVNNQSVTEHLNKKMFHREDDTVEISASTNSVEIQIEDEQPAITKEDAHELISKTEDTVLF